MSKTKVNLICVAHPDDETIFFAGLILRRRRRGEKWVVVCVTSDGQVKRKRQFERACSLLGISETQWWAFQDNYEVRLPVDQIAARLKKMLRPANIFTHGIVGEYGHPHHQDVSYAVHQAFPNHPRLYSVAYNCYPEIEVKLSSEEYALKAKVLSKVYGSETNRFLNVLPSTFSEGFLRLKMKEVEAVYDFLARGKPLRVQSLTANKWLVSYLPQLRNLTRMF